MNQTTEPSYYADFQWANETGELDSHGTQQAHLNYDLLRPDINIGYDYNNAGVNENIPILSASSSISSESSESSLYDNLNLSHIPMINLTDASSNQTFKLDSTTEDKNNLITSYVSPNLIDESTQFASYSKVVVDNNVNNYMRQVTTHADDESNEYRMDSNYHYGLKSQHSNVPPPTGIFIKQENRENDSPINYSPLASSPAVNFPAATTQTGTTMNNSVLASGANPVPKPKRGRVKKPMTLVQRKAHNKIERKYRININSKIANLQKLVPWMSQDGVAFEISNANSSASSALNEAVANNKKLNKSMILDMVTEYVVLLKKECDKKDEEIQKLKHQLQNI